MMPKSCRDCRWFAAKSEKSPMNFCQRFPPQAVPLSIDRKGKVENFFSFAVVSGDNPCGEHNPVEAA